MALLNYYCGSMYAGKSTAAVQDALDARGYTHKVIASLSLASRGYLSRNHLAADLPSGLTILSQLDDLLPTLQRLLASQSTILCVLDEVQFTPTSILQPLLQLAQSHHLDLIVAGLAVGQHAQPFDNHPLLLQYFGDRVQFLYADCALCSKPGLVAVRKWLTADHITDEYSLMCSSCFDKFFSYGRTQIAIPNPL
jgi:thymidine kinase